jgi:iron complex transport system permease protein
MARSGPPEAATLREQSVTASVTAPRRPARRHRRLLLISVVRLPRRPRFGWLPVLTALLFAACIAASAVGAVPISFWSTAQIALNQTHIFHFAQAWSASDQIILLQLRFPRVAGGVLVGAALGAAGVLFQGLLRNPLADPLLLGVSSGAALGATIGFIIPGFLVVNWLGFSLTTVLAFAGSLAAVALVYGLATRGRRTPIVTLLLAGVVVSVITTAAQNLLISLNPQLGLHVLGLYSWLAGAIDVQSWTQIAVMLPVIVLATAASIVLAPVLDAFALGEEMASHLGVSVERCKLAIVALAALLVACAVSLSGIVGFVGLLAPHACRLLLGPRHRLLLPAAALLGAIFVVLADLLARSIVAPAELPLGVVTALVGGPFFLFLLRRFGGGYTW